ncbi:hypothetical protein PCASD_26422 [Puccinia coronata f. sp. avenae]|uniref:Fungal calcium binding protein domain-containing protein n=1 Tax=Puccinia coronata f. sp. avenae TaxID=200324 RepID=A0A2N5TIU3_9BASI|nr:hypothetical protein PCASD_26422 [Puccinia coronata f. sp. avenae]
MQFTCLVTAVLVVYGTNTAASPSTAPPAKTAPAHPPAAKLPPTISINFTQTFYPLPDSEIAAMFPNVGIKGNDTTLPTRAVCATGPAENPDTNICDLNSCAAFPICDTCLGLIVDGAGNIAPDTSSTVNPQAICTNSYLFGNSDDGLKDICTDVTGTPYSCFGGCHGYRSCKKCMKVNLPKDQSTTP